jgi:hypothetical protein
MTGVPVPNTKKEKQAARRGRVAAIRAQQQRAKRRRNLITIGAITAAAAVIIGAVAWYAASRSSGATAEAIPPGVGGGTPLVQPAALVVPNRSGIGGVVAYDTAGWFTASHSGPAARALPHRHVNGPVHYRSRRRWAGTTTRPDELRHLHPAGAQ